MLYFLTKIKIKSETRTNSALFNAACGCRWENTGSQCARIHADNEGATAQRRGKRGESLAFEWKTFSSRRSIFSVAQENIGEGQGRHFKSEQWGREERPEKEGKVGSDGRGKSRAEQEEDAGCFYE